MGEKLKKTEEITYFGVREIRDMTLSKFLRFTDENGIAVITAHDTPRCLVFPLSLVGMKKAIKQMKELYNTIDDDSELILGVQKLLDDILQDIDGD